MRAAMASQQERPVAFDGQGVVGVAGVDQIIGGGVLCVGGVGGDDLIGQVNRVEQGRYAGDLGGVFRDGDLRDDDLLLVGQRGEQLDVHPAWGGAIADGLAIDGQPVEPVQTGRQVWLMTTAGPVGGHAFGQPRPDPRIGMRGVDVGHDPADRGRTRRLGSPSDRADPSTGRDQ